MKALPPRRPPGGSDWRRGDADLSQSTSVGHVAATAGLSPETAARGVHAAGGADGSGVAAVVAVLVAIALSVATVQSKAVTRSGAEGTLPDAERITQFLTEQGLTQGDRVVAKAPSDIPLLYYFVRHHVPTTQLVA